ncbi:MAG: EAL domain-containing protein [Treponema sp.]|nr:EAL domain-containing protein [Treponema sp.]
MIVYTLVIDTILELVTIYIKLHHDTVPIALQWLFQCLYFTASNSFGIIYIMYCMALTDYLNNLTKRKILFVTITVILPYVIALIIIWLGPFVDKFYPMAFSITEEGYVRNNNFWFYILYVIGAYYIIFSIIKLICHRKNISHREQGVVFLYIGIVAVAITIQLFKYGLFVQSFAISIALLMFFFYIQRPEKVLDSITEILNQVSFFKKIDQMFSHNNNFTCIALILDDTVFMGNTIGINHLNMLLKEVASFLKSRFSFTQTFCLNQESFCVIVKNATEERVQSAIKVLQTRFDMPWMYESVAVKLYSRLCVIDCPKDAASSSDIMDIISMMSTDERYKKPLLYARDIDLEDKRRSVYIEHALRNGLTDNRFDVYYQPIYSVAEKQLIGAEALIRLKDEDGNFISPEDFIPIAEKTGTILRIGEFVYEAVCRTISVIDIEDYGIKKIDINLSVAQCMQEILAEQILAIQSIYNIPTSIINLEITETAAAHTPEILLRNMQKLSDAGFELSLDDYGSGYSNMNYMLNLPFKMIKIDKFIVWSAYSDERAEKALAATINMIKCMGMTVLAEGIEDRGQAEWLIKLGCDYLQGFYFSKPVPKDEFLEIMEKRDSKELKIL